MPQAHEISMNLSGNRRLIGENPVPLGLRWLEIRVEDFIDNRIGVTFPP
jgi:hypothetical protein